MSLNHDAHAAARNAYLRALDRGADSKTALDVALAKLRAGMPMADEWELRTALAKLLAADRQSRVTAPT
jgi:hypothetical protein